MKIKDGEAFLQLRTMAPCLLLFNGAALLIIIILGIFYGFQLNIFIGLIVGNLLMLMNFIGTGITAEAIVNCKSFKRGQFLGNLSYGIRYIGIFGILALLLTFGAVNPVSAVVPLFYPKIYYTFFYLRKDEQENS